MKTTLLGLQTEVNISSANIRLVPRTSHLIVNEDESNLPCMYEFIGCRYVTAVEATLAGKLVNIFVDDEGIYNGDDAMFEATNGNFEGQRVFVIKDDSGVEHTLFGALVFAGYNPEDGETLSSPLSSGDVLALIEKEQIKPAIANLRRATPSEPAEVH